VRSHSELKVPVGPDVHFCLTTRIVKETDFVLK
jgi:hypothetical protein